MRTIVATRLIGLLTILVSLPASAYDSFESGGIHYEINNGEAMVAPNLYQGDMVIPSEVTYKGKTYPVTVIEGEDEFELYRGITSLIIPNSVKSIGCIGPCSSLTSLTIGSGVTSIENFAFRYSRLKTVVSKIEKPFAIEETVFFQLPSDAELIVPKGTKAVYQSTSGWNMFSKITEKDLLFEVNGIWYQEGENNSVSVTRGNIDYKGDIIIPERVTYNGKTFSVTGINHLAFENCSRLTSVTIPNSVTSIGGSAFHNCSGLTSVFIPNSVTSIGKCVFYGCSGLTSISIDKSNQQYDSRNNCNAIIETKSNTIIAGCKNTTIPNGVASIGSYVFDGCSGLASITIPNSVTEIGSGAFKGCSGLTSIKVESGNLNYDSRNDCNAIIETSSNTLIFGCKNTTIPNGVTSVGNNAFYNCSGLTSITIPNSVTKIGWSAFQNCSSMTSITISNSLIYVGENAFEGCSNLSSVHITDLEAWCKISFGLHSYSGNPLYYARHLFFNGKEIKDLVIPDGVTDIGIEFIGCSGLTSVTIPNSVTYIGSNAFAYCSSLTSIISEIKNPFKIDSNVFNGIPSNAELIVPKGTKALYLATEGWNKFSKITEADEVQTFTDNGIYYQLKSDGTLEVTGLASWATRADIPSSLTIDGAKYRVTSIGARAFEGRSDITYLSLQYSIKSIGEYAFIDCGSNMTVNIANLEAWCKMELGNEHSSPLSSAGKVLLYDVETTSISIPETVTSIGKYTFYQCKSLTSLYISGSVTSIGSSAFEDCTGLTSVTLSKGLTSIGGSSFEGCKGLTSITIPSTVGSIALNAFKDCSSLNNITSEIQQPFAINENVFSTYDTATLKVPAGTKSAYQSTAGWYKFKNITDGQDVVLTANSYTREYGDPNPVFDYTREGDELIGTPSITCDATATSPVGKYTIRITKGSVANSNVSYVDGTLTITKAPLSVTAKSYIREQGQENPNFEVTYSGFKNGENESVLTIKPTVTTTVNVSSGPGTYDINVSGAEAQNYSLTYNKGVLTVTEKDEVAFTIDGTTYQGTKLEKAVVVKSVDNGLVSVEIPVSVNYDGTTYQVTDIDNDALKGSSLAALIWNVEAVLPNNTFNNASLGSNFLLYVKSASYAPSSVKNVVVDGTAQSVSLSDDGGQFYCPKSFTARSISYTHNYSMETGGNGKGWETIALPFDVQKISHSSRGEIVPFPAYSSSSSQKPFWLANFSGSGFRRTAAVLANEPYIIAMPNSTKYQNEYNLAGDVMFSAENVQVPKTPTFSGTFMPAFSTVKKASSVLALNVNNRYVKYSGSYEAGSCFISGLRDIRPFEAYISDSSTRGVIEIGIDDTTDMDRILFSVDEDQEFTIHTLSGLQVVRTTQRDFDAVWQQLPKGVYIVNGKKWIK